MVGNQQLGDGQGRAMAHLAAILVRPKEIVADRAEIRQVLPDRIFQLAGVLGGDVAVDFQKIGGAFFVAPEEETNAGSVIRIDQIA